ncbi:MAG: HIT family protein [Candidatus Bathyarchaeota archaeon]
MSEKCPFCKIAQGSASASMVYEDSNVLAFMDLHPIRVGHTLVVCRKHWENIYEIPEETLKELIVVVKRVAIAVKKAVGADGIQIVQNNGGAAGQVVMHIHFHVIPMFSRLRKSGRFGRLMENRTMLDETAQKIRQNLK